MFVSPLHAQVYLCNLYSPLRFIPILSAPLIWTVPRTIPLSLIGIFANMGSNPGGWEGHVPSNRLFGQWKQYTVYPPNKRSSFSFTLQLCVLKQV